VWNFDYNLRIIKEADASNSTRVLLVVTVVVEIPLLFTHKIPSLLNKTLPRIVSSFFLT